MSAAPTHRSRALEPPCRLGRCGPRGGVGRCAVAATVWLGLWVTPPDKVQGNLVRLVYVHPPIAWVALYLAFGIAAVSSVLWLWPRTRSRVLGPPGRVGRRGGHGLHRPHPRDRLDLGPADLGGVVGVGRPPHLDGAAARAAARVPGGAPRARPTPTPGPGAARWWRSCAAVDVPIVHFSVDWWRTLHQGATVLNADLSPTIHGSMAWTLLLGFVAFTLAVRVDARRPLPDRGARPSTLEETELDVALQERWAEGAAAADAFAAAPVRGRRELHRRRVRRRPRLCSTAYAGILWRRRRRLERAPSTVRPRAVSDRVRATAPHGTAPWVRATPATTTRPGRLRRRHRRRRPGHAPVRRSGPTAR